MSEPPGPDLTAIPPELAGDPPAEPSCAWEEPAGSDYHNRPTTGDRGTAVRWWQVLAGILGWVAAAILCWYFAQPVNLFAIQLVAILLILAVLLGLLVALWSTQILRKHLVQRRATAPDTVLQPYIHDALGRTLLDRDHLQNRTGETVVVDTPDGRAFVTPAEAEVLLADLAAGRPTQVTVGGPTPPTAAQPTTAIVQPTAVPPTAPTLVPLPDPGVTR
jgi:hypothetical protein